MKVPEKYEPKTRDEFKAFDDAMGKILASPPLHREPKKEKRTKKSASRVVSAKPKVES